MCVFSQAWSLPVTWRRTASVVTPFDPLQPKIPCDKQTSWLHVLYNQSYCRSKFYIVVMGIFLPFRSCDLDLDLMTFIYELDPYPLEMYGMCENKLPTSQLLKAVVNRTDRHDRNYIPCHFAGGQTNRTVREFFLVTSLQLTAIFLSFTWHKCPSACLSVD